MIHRAAPSKSPGEHLCEPSLPSVPFTHGPAGSTAGCHRPQCVSKKHPPCTLDLLKNRINLEAYEKRSWKPRKNLRKGPTAWPAFNHTPHIPQSARRIQGTGVQTCLLLYEEPSSTSWAPRFISTPVVSLPVTDSLFPFWQSVCSLLLALGAGGR